MPSFSVRLRAGHALAGHRDLVWSPRVGVLTLVTSPVKAGIRTQVFLEKRAPAKAVLAIRPWPPPIFPCGGRLCSAVVLLFFGRRPGSSMVDHIGPHLVDSFGRHLEYLRLSVTERCNFRCAYCLPGGCPAGAGQRSRSRSREIDRLVRGFAELGFFKVRLTGGEPTLRRDIVEIVERVAAVPGVRHVGLSTNGYRLDSLARELREAGLTSLNVSVDSLDPIRFASITGRSLLGQVMSGVDAAISAGIPRIKVNAVLLAETGADEIDRFLDWARDAPLTVRFIELMETGTAPALFARPRLPASAIEALLLARGFTRSPRAEGDGPAVDYHQAGHRGRVGIIAPTRKGFCLACNRLRVSQGGDLKLCLFDDRAVSLRPFLSADEDSARAQGSHPERRGAEARVPPPRRGEEALFGQPLHHRRVSARAGGEKSVTSPAPTSGSLTPGPGPLTVLPPSKDRDRTAGTLRAIEVGTRSLHLVSMGLVLGGILSGGTLRTLLWPVIATLLTGGLLLLTTMRSGCLHLSRGAGLAVLLKLLLLGLGNLFKGARLECYVLATIVASVGSHMPSSFRHYTLPFMARRRARREAAALTP